MAPGEGDGLPACWAQERENLRNTIYNHLNPSDHPGLLNLLADFHKLRKRQEAGEITEAEAGLQLQGGMGEYADYLALAVARYINDTITRQGAMKRAEWNLD